MPICSTARQGHESKSRVSAARFRALYHRWGPGHDDASRPRSVFAMLQKCVRSFHCTAGPLPFPNPPFMPPPMGPIPGRELSLTKKCLESAMS